MIFTKNSFGQEGIQELINQKINSRKLNELLLIVPTNRKIRYLRRELIDMSPGGMCGKMNIDTIGTFSQKLFFGEEDFKEDLLSEPAAAVMLKQSFGETDLKYFSTYRKNIPAGTLERIKNVISQYKRLGISPERLKEEAQKLTGSEKSKAEDIAAIYAVYNKKIIDQKLYEIGDVYFELNKFSGEEFTERFRNLFPDVDLIIIQGFDEFTSPEINIINSTSSIDGCRLYLELDYSGANPMVFKHLEDTFRQLVLKKFTPYSVDEIENNKFRKIVRERLFLNTNEKFGEFNTAVSEIKAEDRESEVALIAKEIKEILIPGNVKPNRICVVFNLISNYSHIVRDQFSMIGIPYNLTDRIPLKTSPPVVSLLNLLEILENDFYYNNIFRAFSGDILNNGILNVANLRKASVSLKIISGLKNWEDSLKEAIEMPDDDDESETVNYNKWVFRKAQDDIRYIYNLLSPFDKNLTADQFKHELLKIIDSLHIYEKMVNRNSNLEENIKSFNLFIDTALEILDLVEGEYGKKKFPLKFYLTNLRTAVNSSRFNIKEKPGYGVLVTNLNEIRGLEFDYLFIGGMTDGNLPTRYSPEIFFSGSYFKYEENHAAEERYHFYQSLCSWRKKLYLSYPVSGGNNELSRSTFLNEFENLFEVSFLNEDNYSDSIYSREDLLSYFGKYNQESPEKLFSGNVPDGMDLAAIKEIIDKDKKRLEKLKLPAELQEPVLNESSIDLLKINLNEDFSVTQLESYAKCPYQYFAQRILKLKPVEEPAEEVEGLEIGSLLHSILYEFYTRLKKKGIILSGSNDEEFKIAEDLIFSIANQKVKDTGFSSPVNFFEREKILGIEGDRKASILYEFLLAERKDADGYVPEFFEAGFGNIHSPNKKEDSIKVDIKTGNVKIRGKIDRIDINKEKGTYKVLDYKLSGKKPTADELLNGISLQLPLYLFAAKELIKAQLQKDFSPAGMEIYSLKYKEGEFGRIPINVSAKKTGVENEENVLQELISICLESIEKYVNKIREGRFNLSELKDRENKVCRFCSFKPICRVQEIS
jgi:ATP-dependent helicase/nuclease subunit B